MHQGFNPLRRICRFACGRNMSGVSGVKDATLLWCVRGDLEGGSFRLRKFGTDGRLPFLGRWHFLRFHCVLLVGIEPASFLFFITKMSGTMIKLLFCFSP